METCGGEKSMLLDVGGTATAGCGTALDCCGPAGGTAGGLSLLLLLLLAGGECIESSSTLILEFELVTGTAGTAGGAGGC